MSVLPLADYSDTEQPPIGAYGLRLEGVEGARSLLVTADDTWPRIRIVRRRGRGTTRHDRIDAERAEIGLGDDADIHIERATGRALYTTPIDLRDEELVHPYLAPVPAAVSFWFGRESFHAGALVLGGGVWGVIGERESGKSTTLAWLALHGYSVFADDVLVLENTRAFAGPRSIDLRAEAARELGAGQPLGMVGSRERWRLVLDPVQPELPLHGWLFLAWGDLPELEPVPGPERLRRLVAHRALLVPPADPGALIDLAALPGWELRRPRRIGEVGSTLPLLLDEIAT